ncbi:MAG: metallophosphoesterase family protein [Methanomassiliicoccales archaeon]|jgi:putative phosphoesterase
MKFLIISDIHGRERVIKWVNDLVEEKNADGIIVLGDITQFGPADWAGHFLSSLRSPTYAIPGNCDPPEVIQWIDRSAILLHARKIMLGNEILVGFGGSNPTIFHTPFELQEEEIEKELRKISEKGMILVTHTPPYGINDMVPSGRHVGSTAIKKVVDEFEPKVVLSGHVHEAWGIEKINRTLYVNPGAAKDSRAALLVIEEEPKVDLIVSPL